MYFICHFEKIEMLFCECLKGILSPPLPSQISTHRHDRLRSQQHLVRILCDHHRLPVLLRLHHPPLRRHMRHQHLPTRHVGNNIGTHGLPLLSHAQPNRTDFRQHHGEPLDSHHRNRNDTRRTLDSVYPTNALVMAHEC